MADLILLDRDGNIIHFIKNCKKTSPQTYIGDGVKLKTGRKLREFWVEGAEPTPITNDEGDVIKYKESAYRFRQNKIELYDGKLAETENEVDKITIDKIRQNYSLEEELKLHRLKLSGELTTKEWNNYVNKVKSIVDEGNQYKTRSIRDGGRAV